MNGDAVQMQVTRPGQVAVRTFTGYIGQHLTMVLTGLTTTGGCSRLSVLDPVGVEQPGTSTCSSSGGQLAAGPFDLTRRGTYTVRLVLDTAATGHGWLTVSRPITSGAATVNGSAAKLAVTRRGQPVDRTFTGSIGQHVTLVLDALSTTGGCYSYLRIFDPTGTELDSRYTCDSSGGQIALGPYDLTRGGTYRVRLELNPLVTGSGNLLLSTPVTLGTATLNGPAAKMSVSRFGQPVDRTFTGSIGQHVTLVLDALSTTGGCYSYLRIFDPTGTELDSRYTCDSSGGQIALGPYDLTRGGTYRVRLELNPLVTGSGNLLLSTPVTLGTATLNGPAAKMSVSRFGQPVDRTFTGSIGQHVTLVLDALSTTGGCYSYLRIFDPTGTELDSRYTCDSSGGQIALGPYDLTRGGTYRVRLELNPLVTGSGNLLLSTPVTVGTVTPNGARQPLQVTRYGQPVERTFSAASGQHITVDLDALSTTGGCYSYLRIFDPTGTELDSRYTCDSSGGQITLGPDTLTRSGTYRVRLELNPLVLGRGYVTVGR